MEERRRILRLLEAKMLTVEEAELLLAKLEKVPENENLKNQFDDFEERIKVFGNELGAFLKGTLKAVEDKIAAIFPEQEQK
jgi:hypothetical protein